MTKHTSIAGSLVTIGVITIWLAVGKLYVAEYGNAVGGILTLLIGIAIWLLSYLQGDTKPTRFEELPTWAKERISKAEEKAAKYDQTLFGLRAAAADATLRSEANAANPREN